jgi:hypothetical protein
VVTAVRDRGRPEKRWTRPTRRLPGYGIISYGQLKLLRTWIPPGCDPRFEKLVAFARAETGEQVTWQLVRRMGGRRWTWQWSRIPAISPPFAKARNPRLPRDQWNSDFVWQGKHPRLAPKCIESPAASLPESRDANKSSIFVRKRLKREVDYVTRRFNLSSARLNTPQGLDLR